jgi:MtfA peptidase
LAFYIFIVVILIASYFAIRKWRRTWRVPTKAFPAEWRIILSEKVSFYNALGLEEKEYFEFELQEFLLNYRITGIDTEIDDTDRLLVAASGIIPMFEFPDWKYDDLTEVLIYPSSFNEQFETSGKDRHILGMVGTGYMEGKMILSKQALHHGFANDNDKKNTAIHEFIHLIDKADGEIDGIPAILMQRQYAIPWIDLINQKIEQIHEGKSDINPYGGKNQSEFFAVAAEYFFVNPKILKNKHPKLFEMMEEVFNQDPGERKKKMVKKKIRRNDPCPCGSGKKFKKCCGKGHYMMG